MGKLGKYISLTFLLSWTCWGFGIFMGDNITGIIKVIVYIGYISPACSAIVCLDDEIKSIQDLKSFLFHHKKNTFWIFSIFVFLLILNFSINSKSLSYILRFSKIPPTVYIVIIFLSTTFFGSGLEEIGWRGVMQPELEKRFSPIVTSLIIAPIWAVWHLPLWFLEGTSQHGSSFLSFFVMVLLLTFCFGAIRRKTESVFYCMIFHGLYNTLVGVFPIKDKIDIFWGLLLMAIIGILMMSNKKLSIKR